MHSLLDGSMHAVGEEKLYGILRHPPLEDNSKRFLPIRRFKEMHFGERQVLFLPLAMALFSFATLSKDVSLADCGLLSQLASQ